MNFGIDQSLSFHPIGIAVIIVSDTRTLDTDTSGALLKARIESAGHNLSDRVIIPDDVEIIRKTVQRFIDDPNVNAIISSGGTGLTGRDVTPDAVEPLFDKTIEGFSVLFHHISFQTVGLSTIASRAIAGVSKNTFIFCLPGSNGAVKDGWDKIISQQFDSRYRPCSLVGLIPKLSEREKNDEDSTQ